MLVHHACMTFKTEHFVLLKKFTSKEMYKTIDFGDDTGKTQINDFWSPSGLFNLIVAPRDQNSLTC